MVVTTVNLVPSGTGQRVYLIHERPGVNIGQPIIIRTGPITRKHHLSTRFIIVDYSRLFVIADVANTVRRQSQKVWLYPDRRAIKQRSEYTRPLANL